MKFEEINFIQKDERGHMLDCDKLIMGFRKKGTVSGNHYHDMPEVFYLIHGTMKFYNDDGEQIISKPTKITIQPNEWHRVDAVTDIIFLEDKEKEIKTIKEIRDL